MAVAKSEVSIGLSADDIIHFSYQAAVLCWVLGCEGNEEDDFAWNLEYVKKEFERRGIIETLRPLRPPVAQ